MVRYHQWFPRLLSVRPSVGSSNRGNEVNASLTTPLQAIGDLAPAQMTHELFCCNRRSAATTAFGQRARPSDPHRTWGQAPFCRAPYPKSGTGTAADGGASSLGSARWSRNAAQRFRHKLSWVMWTRSGAPPRRGPKGKLELTESPREFLKASASIRRSLFCLFRLSCLFG